MTLDPGTPLCGHPTCDPYQPRNSILDEQGDVVLFHACDGTRWLFRDNAEHGLLAEPTGTGWALTVAEHVEVEPGRWDMVCRSEPSATIVYIGDRNWEARRQPSGRVFKRWDTQWGLLAATARAYLKQEPTDVDR